MSKLLEACTFLRDRNQEKLDNLKALKKLELEAEDPKAAKNYLKLIQFHIRFADKVEVLVNTCNRIVSTIENKEEVDFEELKRLKDFLK